MSEGRGTCSCHKVNVDVKGVTGVDTEIYKVNRKGPCLMMKWPTLSWAAAAAVTSVGRDVLLPEFDQVQLPRILLTADRSTFLPSLMSSHRAFSKSHANLLT